MACWALWVRPGATPLMLAMLAMVIWLAVTPVVAVAPAALPPAGGRRGVGGRSGRCGRGGGVGGRLGRSRRPRRWPPRRCSLPGHHRERRAPAPSWVPAVTAVPRCDRCGTLPGGRPRPSPGGSGRRPAGNRSRRGAAPRSRRPARPPLAGARPPSREPCPAAGGLHHPLDRCPPGRRCGSRRPPARRASSVPACSMARTTPCVSRRASQIWRSDQLAQNSAPPATTRATPSRPPEMR